MNPFPLTAIAIPSRVLIGKGSPWFTFLGGRCPGQFNALSPPRHSLPTLIATLTSSSYYSSGAGRARTHQKR
jgi:hypothetical protein